MIPLRKLSSFLIFLKKDLAPSLAPSPARC